MFEGQAKVKMLIFLPSCSLLAIIYVDYFLHVSQFFRQIAIKLG